MAARNRSRAARAISLAAVVLALAACGGRMGNPSQSSLLPDTSLTDAAAAKNGRIEVVIEVPTPSPALRRAKYVSPSTKSMAIAIFQKAKHVVTKVANLTAASPGCTNGASGLTCAVAVSLKAGHYAAAVSTYSGMNASGAVLSQGEREAFKIVPARTRQLALTLYGVPAGFDVTTDSDDVTGSYNDGFVVSGIWSAARDFNVVALDADQNAIVGAGAPSFTVSSSSSVLSVTQPNSGEPNSMGLTPVGTQTTSAQITAAATFADSAICALPGAKCSTTFSVQYAPFALDDWMTFAHDFQRTGVQSQPTEITETSVTSLTQRWKAALGATVYGPPIAYDGNVFVVTENDSVLYDLNAANGAIVWQRTIGGSYTKGAPMLDTADGLVIIGVSNKQGNIALPGDLYAVRIADGSIAWEATLGGLIRSAPVYQDGVIYEGWAGGDPQSGCINGGLSAINSKTGAILWTWYTNPATNPGGGGGVWGAIAWDGSHVVFGTGNVCVATTTLSQGAVALNPDGSTAWSFNADPTLTDDNDTGGGVVITAGDAIFDNKNGSFYRVNTTSGAPLGSTLLGSTSGNGGFATPTTDGTMVVTGAGSFRVTADERALSKVVMCNLYSVKPAADPNWDSKLVGIDSAGNIDWSITMQNQMTSYAALDNGMAFAGMDANLDVVDEDGGTILWQFPGVGVVVGAAVVPSGVYTADSSGNVYALSLPAAAPAPAKR